jgi:hypothetical protein
MGFSLDHLSSDRWRLLFVSQAESRKEELSMTFNSPFRLARVSLAAALIGAASMTAMTIAAQAQVSVSVTVNVAPPALPVYDQPPLPGLGYIWTPGYWAWAAEQADYYWVPGTWALAPQPGFLWTPGYWGFAEGGYGFHEGYWGTQVGFYGGISYGFGFTGQGYEGGYWKGGGFFYNRTVNNFGGVHVTNVYEKTVIVNNNVNNVSYNGGRGGTTVKPTAEQIAEEKEHHVAQTEAQRQHAEMASKDRSLFSKENHGKPAIAATSKPGEFKGAGVKPATEAGKGEEGAPMNEKKPEAGAPAENKPGAEEKKPAMEEKKPAMEEKKPAMEEKKPAMEEKKPAMEEKKPAMEEKKPAERPAAKPEEKKEPDPK